MFKSMLAMAFVALLGVSPSPDAFAQQGPKEKGGDVKSDVFEFRAFSTTPIMPGPNVGYPGMNQVCQDDLADPDVRMCTATEWSLSPTAVLPASDAWLGGAPDCSSWTQGASGQGHSVSAVGAFDGRSCADAKLVTCCARLN